jgi:hypothetical protein
MDIPFFEKEGQRTEDHFAVRWRLEPKNAEDAAKNKKRSELIEPKETNRVLYRPTTLQNGEENT